MLSPHPPIPIPSPNSQHPPWHFHSFHRLPGLALQPPSTCKVRLIMTPHPGCHSGPQSQCPCRALQNTKTSFRRNPVLLASGPEVGENRGHKKIEMIDISTIVLRDLAGAPAHWVDYGRSHHPDPIPRRAVRALAPFLLAFVGALEGRMAPDRGLLATTT